jgi:hypothetical protein
MSYADDMAKHAAECKAAHDLWEVWQQTKKDEDKDKWWAALSGIKSKKYLTIQLKIWPGDDVDADKIKEMLESNNTSLPWTNEVLFHGDQILGEIIEARASVWPKASM